MARVGAQVVLVLALSLLGYAARQSVLRAVGSLVLGIAAVAVSVVLRRRRAAAPPAPPPPPGARLRRRLVMALGLAQAVVLAVVDVRWFPLVAVVGEGLLLVVAVPALVLARRRFLVRRAAGQTRQDALLGALEHELPPVVLRVLRTELTVLGSAVALLRPRPQTAERWPYGRAERTLLYALAPVAATEAVVVHYLLRGSPLRWPALALTLLALPYLVGFIGQTAAYPHLLHADRLVLRDGPSFSLTIPRQSIARVTERLALDPARARHWRDGGTLVLPSGGRTTHRLDLAHPVELGAAQVRAVELSIDGGPYPGLQQLLGQ